MQAAKYKFKKLVEALKKQMPTDSTQEKGINLRRLHEVFDRTYREEPNLKLLAAGVIRALANKDFIAVYGEWEDRTSFTGTNIILPITRKNLNCVDDSTRIDPSVSQKEAIAAIKPINVSIEDFVFLGVSKSTFKELEPIQKLLWDRGVHVVNTGTFEVKAYAASFR